MPAEDAVPERQSRTAARRLPRAAAIRTAAAVAVALLLRWALRLGLPVLGAEAMLQALPYQATVEGVPFEVQGTLFARTGLSADTTLGSWQFPDVTALPVGVHVRPENVDVLQLSKAASGDLPGFVERLRIDFADRVPVIVAWLAGELLLGALIGLGAAAAINMAVRYQRGLPRRPHEWRSRALQLGAALGVVVLAAGFGWLTYNPHWVRRSQLTGTLAAAQLFPDQLAQYYSQNSKVFDVLGSVIGIQAALQERIDATQTPDTALRVMFISDMHLAANYPLVQQYVRSYGVDLLINTGDETEFGTAGELTPDYLDQLRAVTATTPMIWLAGNHDSPDVESLMGTIPGVTVLGSKTPSSDGGYAVTATEVDAFGLTVAGLPDPRVYGAPGPYGADAADVVDPLERRAVDRAVRTGHSPAATTAPSATSASPGTSSASATGDGDGDSSTPGPAYDIFATHEPVAAQQLRKDLPGAIRQTDAGHTHHQNAGGDIQNRNGTLDLVEGSTGAGGLDNIVRGTDRPPIEFSIESVSSSCQFTRIVRFQVSPTAGKGGSQTTAQPYGDDVTASTVYFEPQTVSSGRTCGSHLGISTPRPVKGG